MTLKMHDAIIRNCGAMISHQRACFHCADQWDGYWCVDSDIYRREEFMSPSRAYVFENFKLILNLGIRQ